jgi:GTP-binding protein
MIDTVRLNIKGGSGGNGCVSFLREKYRPMGGPNGGDGGHGGNVYVCGDSSFNTLLHLKFNSTIYADKGIHGKGKTKRGADGGDTTIKLPLGTAVYLRDAAGEKSLIVDVVDTVSHLVARGGVGGWGNTRFVSATNQEPVLAQTGEKGQSVVLFMELKLLADVGLIARPNAGKSTLLQSCSAAKPKVADYPFTTVEPVLGVVSSRGKDFVMMEVPGLLEGAHLGIGLGHQFLRHAERTRVYVHVLDGTSEDPVADLRMLKNELRQFNPILADKQEIVVVNKVDIPEVRQRKRDIERNLRAAGKAEGSLQAQEPTMFISAATGEGVDTLLGKLVELLDTLPVESTETSQSKARSKRQPRHIEPKAVYKEDGVYVVVSGDLERLVALADTRDPRVIVQLWREMTRLGLGRQLTDAGIEPGDTIRLGQVEVEWF